MPLLCKKCGVALDGGDPLSCVSHRDGSRTHPCDLDADWDSVEAIRAAALGERP